MTKKLKEKKELHSNQYGWVNLKRWNKEEGFYIEFESNTEDPSSSIYCKGNTLQECIENLTDECPFSLKELFSVYDAEQIIDTFELTEEDMSYINEVGEKADF